MTGIQNWQYKQPKRDEPIPYVLQWTIQYTHIGVESVTVQMLDDNGDPSSSIYTVDLNEVPDYVVGEFVQHLTREEERIGELKAGIEEGLNE